MVSAKWSCSLAAAGASLLVSSSPLDHRQTRSDYTANALSGIKALQGWYDKPTGLWNTSGWWNSANCLTVLADWALMDQTGAASLDVSSTMSTTFTNAQKTDILTHKSLSATGQIMSTYTIQKRSGNDLEPRGFSGFLNDFYDDEGWWALGFIRSWDLTRDQRYLDMAESIFADMKNGTDSVCGGGIWWSKERRYKNAIANELYLSVAASLANRVNGPGKKDYYLQIARDEWAWFKGSGMINSQSLVNDGLLILENGTCVNNGMPTWSYNQGVVLGGLVELSKAAGDASYMNEASRIAKAAVAMLTDAQGIIRETDRCEPNCGADGSQFKGIFVRNLHYLHKAQRDESFRSAMLKNADSIWANNRNGNNQLGIHWAGPANLNGGPNATTHTSAMDVLVGAMAAS